MKMVQLELVTHNHRMEGKAIYINPDEISHFHSDNGQTNISMNNGERFRVWEHSTEVYERVNAASQTTVAAPASNIGDGAGAGREIRDGGRE